MSEQKFQTIDMLGRPCPMPVIEAKKALASDDCKAVVVLVDNIVAVQNLEKMAIGRGHAFAYTQEGDNYHVTISKQASATPIQANSRDVAATVKINSTATGHVPVTPLPTEGTVKVAPKQTLSFCGNCDKDNLVVAIGRDHMGDGAEELGKILIKGFIYSLSELEQLPKTIVFFNGGAKLTTEGASTIDDLKKMAEAGVEIFTCGTCINYYELQGKLAVGEVTDMYGITTKLSAAGKLIQI